MSEQVHSSGSLFLVVAPSGAGKSSLVNALLQQEPAIKLSIPTLPAHLGRANSTVANISLRHQMTSWHAARRMNFWNRLRFLATITAHRAYKSLTR